MEEKFPFIKELKIESKNFQKWKETVAKEEKTEKKM